MSRAANAGLLSNAAAVRQPVPVITKTIALPEIQAGRFLISCTMFVRSGVRWSTPASLTLIQGTGAQATVAVVRGRLETFCVTVENAGGLSAAWPAIVSCVGVDPVSSTVNCMYADV